MNYRIGKLTLGGVLLCAVSSLTFAQPEERTNNREELSLEEVDGESDSAGQGIEETYVLGQRRGNFTEITQETEKLVDMPGALGDPLGAVFSLPGVVYGDGGEPAVRGSSPDDNLFLVDFLPAGYIFHDFNTSIFHEYIMHDFQLYSAGFGPEYGNVTGAVFDINLRQPRKQPLQTVLDLSMLRSGVFLEGQVTESSAFYLSGRHSMLHLFIPEGEENEGVVLTRVPRDNDYQLKYAWDLDANNTLTFSASGAGDLAEAVLSREMDFVRSNPDFEGDAEILSRFNGQKVIWDHQRENGGRLKVGGGHLNNERNVSWGNQYYYDESTKSDTLKAQYSQPVGNSHLLTVGGMYQQNSFLVGYDQVLFVCTEFDVDCTLNRDARYENEQSIDQVETHLYVNDSWQATPSLVLDIGLQLQENDYTNERFVNPRAGLRYQLNSQWAIASSAGQYNRFPELEYVLPEIGNENLQSPTATHYTLGVDRELNDGWSWSLEAYYKLMDNLPLALAGGEDNSALLYSNDVSGEATGVDVFINKEMTTNWYSWLALSYSLSERTNDRSGETVNYYLDTPMILNWVVNYSRSETFNVGWRWTIRSGTAYTPIVGIQENPWFDDSVLPEYGDPYSDRLPLTSRLDVRFKWLGQLWGMDTEYIVDILNALNQENVTGVGLDYEKVDSVNDPLKTEENVSPGIIAALGMRLKF
ncbi:TonB-dependent receptor plug domain-containing protein [Teredinibacter purpureus]|uniref:TonB-dependent receptor plug domain-containing protein n=1 Tax=Teredinibacter purpureus TaxID=2731756 RepID=UPI000B022780|nr:TonB-dependent receptor [Teredinibacter purpureus]